PGGEYVVYWEWLGAFDYTTTIVDWETGETVEVDAAPLTYPHQPYQLDPSGERLMAVTGLCTDDPGLALLDRDGTLTPVISDFVFVPRFSPDGSRIAYTNGTELYVVPTDGSEEPRL